MIYSILITSDYLWIPVSPEQPLEKISFMVGDKRIYEFMIPVSKGSNDKQVYPFSFYSPVPVDSWKNREMTIIGSFTDDFINAVKQSDDLPTEVSSIVSTGKTGSDASPEVFPLVHFAAPGWINDPNGLFYKDGLWHLYFQYNPFDTRWQNMTWGHAVSHDLLHWTQHPSVLFPDGTGSMFSGSCLPLSDELLSFFYTSAGDATDWGKEYHSTFTQRVALSTDNGETLIKTKHKQLMSEIHPDDPDNLVLLELAPGNRDPKVYRDEINGGFYMVLFLEKNDYAVLHSEGNDFTRWKLTQRLSMAPGWECPDLRQLPSPKGKRWLFWTSDGFYHTGSFDGYCFTKDSEGPKRAYLNSLAYAGQSFQIYRPGRRPEESSADKDDSFYDRVVFIHWLRTSNKEHSFTGIMGIPRELYLDSDDTLHMSPVKEWTDALRLVSPDAETFSESSDAGIKSSSKEKKSSWSISHEAPLELDITEIEDAISVNVFGLNIDYWSGSHLLRVEKGNADFHEDHKDITVPDPEPSTDIIFPEAPKDIRLIIDRGIVEVSANSDSLNAFFEVNSYELKGTVTVEGSCSSKLYIIAG
ncbi:beta-fructosidase, levanase/invertase [Lachnospiraceae bacterium JC7]|nr:beta-fructosidase, levanase/invertase [Lachnospiraceae bacterium JC7]